MTPPETTPRAAGMRHRPPPSRRRAPYRRLVPWWFLAVALVAVGTAAFERCRLPDAAGRPTWTVRVVHDGDTVTCHDNEGRAHRIRLLGIDAPEFEQRHGDASRAALARKVGERRVAVESRGFDRHGRLLATLWIDERNINREMVEEGHAWAFGGIAPDPDIVDAEGRARRGRRGLWADDAAEEPSRWRAEHPRHP